MMIIAYILIPFFAICAFLWIRNDVVFDILTAHSEFIKEQMENRIDNGEFINYTNFSQIAKKAFEPPVSYESLFRNPKYWGIWSFKSYMKKCLSK